MKQNKNNSVVIINIIKVKGEIKVVRVGACMISSVIRIVCLYNIQSNDKYIGTFSRNKKLYLSIYNKCI